MPSRKRQAYNRRTAVTDAPDADANDADNGEKKPPAHRFQLRNVRAAVWKNARPDGTVWYSATFARRYCSAGGKWHSADSFGANDLLTLAEVAREAFLWIETMTQGEEGPY
jgi:hypothetical protein